MALAHQQTSSTDHEQAAPEQGGGQRTSGGRGNGHANAERGDGEAGATVDLVRRIEKTFGRWEEAIAGGELPEAELQLAGLGTLLRQLPDDPEVLEALAPIAERLASPDPEPDTLLADAKRATARLALRERRAGAYGPEEDTETAEDLCGELGRSLVEQVNALEAAFQAGESGALRRLLAGDNAALKRAYEARYGRLVTAAITSSFPQRQHLTLLHFADRGELDAVTEAASMCMGILGAEVSDLFAFVEGASDPDRQAMSADAALQAAFARDLNEAELARVRHALAQEKDVLPTLPGLRLAIESRKGWMTNDEEAMLADIRAWASARGKLEGDDLEAALAIVEPELSAEELAEARALLRTGGQLSLADEVEVAASQTTLWISDTDEDRLYKALRAATPAERELLRQDEDGLEALKAALDPGEWLRASLLLESNATGGAAEALDAVLDLMDGWVLWSESFLFDALSAVASSDLSLLATGWPLGWFEAHVDDTARLHTLLGLGAADPAAPEADGDVLVERLRQATRGLDDVDAAYRTVIAWQDAGGSFIGDKGRDTLLRARDAIADLDDFHRVKLENALDGITRLTWEDRLVASGHGLGTQDGALEDTLRDVPDEVLVLEWSNLPDFAARVEGITALAEVEALRDFVPEVKPSVLALLHRERDDAVALIADTRERLRVALEEPALVELARQHFGYVPNAEDLERLRYAWSLHEQRERREGDGNALGRSVVDTFAHDGPESEADFAAHHHAVDQGLDSETQDQTHEEWLASGEDYAAAKAAAAAMAGSLASVAVSFIATLATGGAALALAPQLLQAVIGAGAQELVEAAIMGDEAKVQDAAPALAAALVQTVVSRGMGKLAKSVHAGVSATEAAQGFYGAMEEAFGPALTSRMKATQKLAIELPLKEFPKAYAKDLVMTEGLLRRQGEGAFASATALAEKGAEKFLVLWVAGDGKDAETLRLTAGAELVIGSVVGQELPDAVDLAKAGSKVATADLKASKTQEKK